MSWLWQLTGRECRCAPLTPFLLRGRRVAWALVGTGMKILQSRDIEGTAKEHARDIHLFSWDHRLFCSSGKSEGSPLHGGLLEVRHIAFWIPWSYFCFSLSIVWMSVFFCHVKKCPYLRNLALWPEEAIAGFFGVQWTGEEWDPSADICSHEIPHHKQVLKLFF